MIPTRGQFIVLPTGQRARIERVLGPDRHGRWNVAVGGKVYAVSWARGNPDTASSAPKSGRIDPYDLNLPSKRSSYEEIVRQVHLYNDDPAVRRYYDKIGIDFRRSLGSGYFGSAFASKDDEWIVKLTGDRHEAEMVNVVRRLRAAGHGDELRGIVAYKQDAVVAPKSKGLWVIVRENIKPGLHANDAYYLVTENREQAAGLRSWKNMKAKDRTDYGYGRAMERAEKALSALESVDGFRYFVQTMRFMWDRGLPPADAHTNNIGRTVRSWFGRPSGSAVVFDWGAVKPTEEDKPPRMKRMSRLMKTPKRKHKTQLRFGFSKQRVPRSEKWRSR